MRIDFTKVVPVDDMCSEESEELHGYLQDAREYLNFYNWHSGIIKSYFGFGVSDVFVVFLFEIEPAREDVDNYVWVILGDLPPAYITCEDSPNPACALDSYIGAMTEWAEASIYGNSVVDLIPVNVPSTPENGEALMKRLKLLDEKVLAFYQEDLKA